jgi:hypothetical protein
MTLARTADEQNEALLRAIYAGSGVPTRTPPRLWPLLRGLGLRLPARPAAYAAMRRRALRG